VPSIVIVPELASDLNKGIPSHHILFKLSDYVFSNFFTKASRHGTISGLLANISEGGILSL
jgi:hypothetical protein